MPVLSTRVVIVACVVVVVGSVAAGIELDRHSGDQGAAGASTTTTAKPPALSRRGSEVVPGRPAPVTVRRVPAAWSVTYRVEGHDGSRPTHSTQIITVRRPFDARIEERQGDPPGQEPAVVRTTRLGVLASQQSPSEATVLSPAPAPAGSDLRPDISLEQAVQESVLERREVRTVAGRRCQVYRAGGAITAGELVPPKHSSERDEFCVDDAGLVLEDVWWKDDVWLQRRVAVEVNEAPAVDDGLFRLAGEQVVSFEAGNGSVRPVDPTTLPTGPGWRVSHVPDGFTLSGRYAVVPVGSQQASDVQSPSIRDTASVIDVYRRGVDVIEVEQGIAASPEVARFKPSPVAVPTDLGPLGDGEAILDLRANEVRAGMSDGRFVRVFGTVPLPDLIDVARHLEAVAGSGIRYVDQ